jgi:hypothetical protein
MNSLRRSVVAGLSWGLLGAVIYSRMPWYGIVGAVVAGPFVGIAVFFGSRWSYSSRSGVALWTIPSVYIAVAMFGLVIGVLDSVMRGTEMIVLTVVSSLWGISIPSPFWLLFPLAFATHLWVRAGRRGTPCNEAVPGPIEPVA